MSKKEGRELIIIYFNIPEDVLLERIKMSGRSKKCLYHSKDFVDLLVNKQKQRFEEPNKKEADYFFEVNNDSSSIDVFNKVLNLIKK
jgi:thymidylate kinase